MLSHAIRLHHIVAAWERWERLQRRQPWRCPNPNHNPTSVSHV